LAQAYRSFLSAGLGELVFEMFSNSVNGAFHGDAKQVTVSVDGAALHGPSVTRRVRRKPLPVALPGQKRKSRYH
jgi:hypothetical protein